MNVEYYLFTKEDPVTKLKAMAKGLSIRSKMKVAPHIRSCESFMRKSKRFRDLINQETAMSEIIGSIFVLFFEEKIDKRKFMSIPRDASTDFLVFFGTCVGAMDDKYIKKAQKIIISLSEDINYFVRAFHNIRLAQGEIDKLKKS